MIHINSYLFSKISNIISIFFIKKRTLSNGIYLIGKSNKAKDSKIIFDLSDPDFIHIGDTFFFEPILRLFSENFSKVYVMPNKNMEFYFKDLGYNLISKNYDNNDFIISHTHLISKVRGFDGIVIDTAQKNIPKRLIDNINFFLTDYFNFSKKVSSIPLIPISNSLLYKSLKIEGEVIIFSNYINSGISLTFAKKRKKLISFLNEYTKNKTATVLHLGTAKDKLSDNFNSKKINNYIDLRGVTDIKDVFGLFQKFKITYIGFDNFLMHLGFIYECKLFVKSRGRLVKGGNKFLMEKINPPFNSKLNFVLKYI